MFKPPAHKSNSAGQIVNKEYKSDEERYFEGFRPPKYLRDVVKAAQERASEEFATEMATLPSTSAEKRLAGLERALWSLIRDIELRTGCSTNWYSNELKKILQENS